MARPWTRVQEVRLGVAVIAAVGVVFALITQTPKIFGPKMMIVKVRFPLSIGLQGISGGSPIEMAGLTIGRVDSVAIEMTKSTTDGAAKDFLLTASIDAKSYIPRTTQVRVRTDPLGGHATLVLNLPPRSGDMRFGPHDPDDDLHLAPEQGLLASIFGQTRAEQLEVALAHFNALDLGAMKDDFASRWSPITAATQSVWRDGRSDWQAWSAQGNALLDGWDAARARWAEIEGMFDKGSQLDLARLEPAIERIRAQLDSSGTQLTALRKKWSEEVEPPLSDLIARIKREFAIIEADAAVVMAIWNDSKGMAGNANADLQMTGDQLARTTREITLMPWTLLGGAFADKSERARFLKAAHEVVRSTGELSLSVSFAQELLKQDPALVERYPELVALMQRWMEAAAAKQKSAGQELLNELLGRPEE
ncbi:MAG: MlaD family protein [Planctomycetota bacterium]